MSIGLEFVSGRHSTDQESVEGDVRTLLNNIMHQSLESIVERLAQMKLHNAEQQKFVINTIFEKAVHEPHNCKTFAELAFALKEVYPVKRLLQDLWQVECQGAQHSLQDAERGGRLEGLLEDSSASPQVILEKQNILLASAKFTGHLFLRNLVARTHVRRVVDDLIGVVEVHNTGNLVHVERLVECIVELLQAIAPYSDKDPSMDQFVVRLSDLGYKICLSKPEIHIHMLSGKDIVVAVEVGETVRSIKGKIERQEEIPARYQKILFGGSELTNEVLAGLASVCQDPSWKGGCFVCGYSREFDDTGDRWCWCDACRGDGCRIADVDVPLQLVVSAESDPGSSESGSDDSDGAGHGLWSRMGRQAPQR